jgi:phosphatidylglycerophosphatase A
VSPADRLACIVAALGPLGFLPVAPASWASLVLAALYAVLPGTGLAVDAAAVLLVTVVAVWAAGRAERIWGHDASHIVADEGAGMAVTLFLLPAGPRVAVLAFFAFRFFDILKPPPGRQAERLPGGYGVVADDLVAGVFANLTVRAALWGLGRLA